MIGDETNVDSSLPTINHERQEDSMDFELANIADIPICNQAPAASNTRKPPTKCVGGFRHDNGREFCTVHDRWLSHCEISDLARKLAQLQERNGELIETSTFQHQVILESEKEIADLEKRHQDLLEIHKTDLIKHERLEREINFLKRETNGTKDTR